MKSFLPMKHGNETEAQNIISILCVYVIHTFIESKQHSEVHGTYIHTTYIHISELVVNACSLLIFETLVTYSKRQTIDKY